MKTGDLKEMIDKLERGQITYQEFQNYVERRPEVGRDKVPEWWNNEIWYRWKPNES